MTLLYWPLVIFHTSLFCLTKAFNLSVHSTAAVGLLSTLSWTRAPGDPSNIQIVVKDIGVPGFQKVILPSVPSSENGTISLLFNNTGEFTIQGVASNGSLITTLATIDVVVNSTSVSTSLTPTLGISATITATIVVTSPNPSTSLTEETTSSGISTPTTKLTSPSQAIGIKSPIPSTGSTEKPTSSGISTPTTKLTSPSQAIGIESPIPSTGSTEEPTSSGISTPRITSASDSQTSHSPTASTELPPSAVSKEEPTSSGSSTPSIATTNIASTSPPLSTVSKTLSSLPFGDRPVSVSSSSVSTSRPTVVQNIPNFSTATTTIASTISTSSIISNSIQSQHPTVGVSSSTKPQSSDVTSLMTATSEDSSQMISSTVSGIPPATESSSHVESATPASMSNAVTAPSEEPSSIPTSTQDSQTTPVRHTAVILGASIGAAFLAITGSIGTAAIIVLRRRRHRPDGGLRILSLGSNAFSYQALGRSSSLGSQDTRNAAVARETNVGSPWSSRPLRRIRSLIRSGRTRYQGLPSNLGDEKLLQDVLDIGPQHGSRSEDSHADADAIPEAWWNDSRGVMDITSQSTARINATGSMASGTLNAYDALTHVHRLQIDQPQSVLTGNHNRSTRDMSLPLATDADSLHSRQRSSVSSTQRRETASLSLTSIWADSDPSRESREFRRIFDDLEARWAMEGYMEPIAPDERPPSYGRGGSSESGMI